MLHHLALGQLEGQQHATPDLGGVLYGLQPGRERSPLVVAEVGMRGPGCQDKVVVGHAGAARQAHLPRLGVDGNHLVHQHLGVFLMAQDGADGLRNIGRGKHRQRHLVEQRLEGVVILAVDDRDVDGQFA